MNETHETLAGINISAEPLIVKHASLTRVDNSSHKSSCPVCKLGLLLMRRNKETFLLENKDNCVLCGQMFEYSDIPNNELMSLQNEQFLCRNYLGKDRCAKQCVACGLDEAGQINKAKKYL